MILLIFPEMLTHYKDFLSQSFQKRLYEAALRCAIATQRILYQTISFFGKVRAKNICIQKSVVLLLWLFFRAYTAILDDYATYRDFYVIVIMFLEWLFGLAFYNFLARQQSILVTL